MSMELIAICGVAVAIISVGIALAAFILTGLRNLRTDMQAQRAEINGLREEMQTEFKAVREEIQTEFKAVREEMQTEFKAVRKEINGLRERMAYMEGLLEGLREAITGQRVAGAKAVAEDPGQYDPS